MVDLRVPVLVIDDEPHSVGELSEWLREMGFLNILEDDGSGVVELLRTGPAGIVIAHGTVARDTSLNLVRTIRKMPDLVGTHFIMVTDRFDSVHRTSAIDAGVDAYLAKPFTPENMARVISATLSRRGAAA